MFQPRTFRIFALLLVAYGLLLLPGFFWPAYLDSPIGILVLLPYLTALLLHGLGIPGMLAQGGLCGWGWCAPTVLGWLLGGGLWVGVLWLVSRGIASLTAPTEQACRTRPAPDPGER